MKVIKCPICHANARFCYLESRIYECKCEETGCSENIKITAHSEVEAEGIFQRFEQTINTQRFQIPKWVAKYLMNHELECHYIGLDAALAAYKLADDGWPEEAMYVWEWCIDYPDMWAMFVNPITRPLVNVI
jgi:hypothetical protein